MVFLQRHEGAGVDADGDVAAHGGHDALADALAEAPSDGLGGIDDVPEGIHLLVPEARVEVEDGELGEWPWPFSHGARGDDAR